MEDGGSPLTRREKKQTPRFSLMATDSKGTEIQNHPNCGKLVPSKLFCRLHEISLVDPDQKRL